MGSVHELEIKARCDYAYPTVAGWLRLLSSLYTLYSRRWTKLSHIKPQPENHPVFQYNRGELSV